MARMTGGEALVKQLYREGVRVVFGLPGVQLYGAVAALRDEPSIRFVVTRHEQATSYMADGYARAGARHDEGRTESEHGARVSVGDVARRLLVASDDKADARLVPERGHRAVELDAGQAEYDAHAFSVELLHERLAAGHPCHLIAPLECGQPRRPS